MHHLMQGVTIQVWLCDTRPACIINPLSRQMIRRGFHTATFVSFHWHHYSVKPVNLKPQTREEPQQLTLIRWGCSIAQFWVLSYGVLLKSRCKAVQTLLFRNTYLHKTDRYSPAACTPARSQFWAGISGSSQPGNELSKSSKWPRTNTWTPLQVLERENRWSFCNCSRSSSSSSSLSVFEWLRPTAP